MSAANGSELEFIPVLEKSVSRLPYEAGCELDCRSLSAGEAAGVFGRRN